MSLSTYLLPGDQIVRLRTGPREVLGVSGPKQYRPDHSWLEEKQIRVCLENQRNLVGTERVEKIQNLSKAEWVSEVNKARVTKKVGKHWEIFGHSKDNEDWLYAEEALYMLETSALELTLDDVPLSVEQSYAVLLGGACSLDEYRVYSHLLKRGFRVLRHDDQVRVTRYEKDIVLDQVVTRQKRSFPGGNKQSSVEEMSDPGVDVDEGLARKDLGDVIFLSESSNVSSDVIVLNESDSEDDMNRPVNAVSNFQRSYDDSGRNWFCSVKDWVNWQDEIEELAAPFELKSKKRFFDTSQKPVREILLSLPNVKSGISLITSPDQRLIPPSIIPKHLQYRVNLMNSDPTCPNRRGPREENVVVHDLTVDDVPCAEMPSLNLNSNIPLPNTNQLQMNPQFITNSILTQAHSIQIMAMGMIRSSLQMLTTFQSQRFNFPHQLQARGLFNGRNTRTSFRGRVTKRSRWWRRGFNRRGGVRGGGGGRGRRRGWRKHRPSEAPQPQTTGGIVIVDDDDHDEPNADESDPDEILEMTPPEKKQKIEIVDLDTPVTSPEVEEINGVDSVRDAKKIDGEAVTEPDDVSGSVEIAAENGPSASNVLGEPSHAALEDGPDECRVMVNRDESEGTETEFTSVCDEDKEKNSSDIKAQEPPKERDPQLEQEDPSLGTWQQFKLTSEFTESAERIDVTPLYNSTSCSNLDNLLKRLQIFSPISLPTSQVKSHLKISFDLYQASEHFKKSLKQLPQYRVVVMKASQDLPSFQEMSSLKARFEDGIAFLFAVVLEEGLSFFLFDFVGLPVCIEV